MTTTNSGPAAHTAPHAPARPPRDVRGFWRILLAIVAPLAPLGTAATILAQPYPISADPAAALAATAAHPGAEQAAQWLNLIPTFLIVPAVIALALVTRRRSPKLTTVGAILALLGYTAFIQLPNTDLINLIAVRHGLDHTQVITLVTAVQAHPLYVAEVLIFVVGHVIGQILLGIALWRTRLTPRWMALILILALPADFAAGAAGTNPAAAAAWVLAALGFAGTSVALLRTRNDDFDLPALPRKAHR